MGRPISKRKIGQGGGRIAVTNVKFADNTTYADDENGVRVYIEKQRSTKRFLVKTSDGLYSEVCYLVSKSTPLAAGTFDIAVEVGQDLDEGGGDGSTIYWAKKLKNRTIDVAPDLTTAPKTFKYTLGTAQTDEENLFDGPTVQLGIVNVDVQ
jgi:hypothetical protein